MLKARHLLLMTVALVFACGETGNDRLSGPVFDLAGDSLPPDTTTPPDTTPPPPPDTIPPDTIPPDTTPPPPQAEVARIRISPNVVQLAVGDSASLVANLFDRQGNPICCRNVAFVIADSSVAIIESAFGQFAHVRALAKGRVTVTAFLDGRQDRAQIVVR